MSHERLVRDVPIGLRGDGTPWMLRFVEHRGSSPGPATAILGGMYGDKPIGCLAVHELDRRLSKEDELVGSVLIAPALNLPAIENRTRVNPDHHALNRRFPGSASGFLTDQFANAIQRVLVDEVDCVIDLHSGTPDMALWYTYDFGNIELSASFGYLPVVLGHRAQGQLGTHLADHGIASILPEFGGGMLDAIAPGVEGALNVLRYRGNLNGTPTGPRTVPLISDRRLVLASTVGALQSPVSTGDVGKPVEAGRIAWVTNVTTGEVTEEFTAEAGAILLMTRLTPTMVGPGDFALMLGYPERDLDVPGR